VKHYTVTQPVHSNTASTQPVHSQYTASPAHAATRWSSGRGGMKIRSNGTTGGSAPSAGGRRDDF
jgi:hypothetical protein